MQLYQTLEDRNNPDKILKDGPFKCERTTAWLGFGYYFWDTHIELSHWWGETVYIQKGKNYIITSCFIVDNSDDLWDLVGVGKHRIEFKRFVEELEGEFKGKEITVPKVITYLLKFNLISYQGIRVLPERSVKSQFYDKFTYSKIRFIDKNTATLDLIPPIQVCLFGKKCLNLNDYCIVYPGNYTKIQDFA
jgi:hypothetical protein